MSEDRQPRARIHCRQFLLVEGIQRRVALETIVSSLGHELVAREQSGIVGIIAKIVRSFSDVIAVCYSSGGWRCLTCGNYSAPKMSVA